MGELNEPDFGIMEDDQTTEDSQIEDEEEEEEEVEVVEAEAEEEAEEEEEAEAEEAEEEEREDNRPKRLRKHKRSSAYYLDEMAEVHANQVEDEEDITGLAEHKERLEDKPNEEDKKIEEVGEQSIYALMTPKEAFRRMSYKFHGKKPSKAKRDNLLKVDLSFFLPLSSAISPCPNLSYFFALLFII